MSNGHARIPYNINPAAGSFGANGLAANPSPRLNTPNLNANSKRPTPPDSAAMAANTTTNPRSEPSGSRAIKFEDEKRRIIESCFSKLDQNGQLAESYITHIRITEDASYPSAPPPPDASPEHKKPRLIIIAVRSTGRVRMHKARENNNGSFSIGKTWNMEELSCIESFANPPNPPQSDREAQHRAWAGNVGFTVTISKPYYWQAGTSKEKDFFIASAVKIYRKYTKGQVPDLRGFDDREKTHILGALPGPASSTAHSVSSFSTQRGPPPSSRAASEQGLPPEPPQPPFAQREQSRDGSRYRGSPGPPPSVSDGRPGSGPNSRRPSGSPARFGPGAPPAPNGPRPFASTEQMRQPSRDGTRPAELRPGTSPGPGQRQPIGVRNGVLPPPSQGFPPSHAPQDHAPAPLRPRSPAQRPVHQHIDGASEERASGDSGFHGNNNGTSLFHSARDRFMNYQPPAPESARTPPPQQIAPIDTTPTPLAQPDNSKPALDRQPKTAASDSSAGIDLGDAATIGALTSYWGPEHSTAAPTPPHAEPQSPSTPERSSRRLAGGVRSGGESVDLRPAPLQARSPPPQDVERKEQGSADAESIGSVSQVEPLQPHRRTQSQKGIPHALAPSTMQASPVSSPPETPDVELGEEEQYRPGLGPMFKKRAIAGRFKKAASAASAFKPRPGGAAEKILRAKAERDGEPDGITGVVPRPHPRMQQHEEQVPVSTVEPPVQNPVKEELPTVEISSPQSPMRTEEQPSAESRRSVELFDEPVVAQPEPERDIEHQEQEQAEQRQVRLPQVKIKRRSAQQEKYLASLGIDRALLEDRGLDFELMLADFGWSSNILQPKQLAALETDIRREQGRVEAGSWLSHADDAREERVSHVEGLLDKAIAECDELEGLLTLYHVELSSLNDDIAFIEAQSQGLQVQSANQKLLQSELQGIVETMSLDRRVMEPLRYGNFSDPHALDEIESSLVRLYQAMLTMDPTMRSAAHSRPRSRSGLGDHETSTMVALREKKVVYDRETAEFCQRLMQYLDSTFMSSMNSAKSSALRVPGAGGLPKLQAEAFQQARVNLWMYSPLLLFTRELNRPAWHTLMRMYQQRANSLYKDSFKENIHNWKRAARPSTGDEIDVLFTTQEKEDPTGGGLTSTARKLTVKRSQTLAKSLRNASGEKPSASEHKQPGAMIKSQAFAGALDEMAPLVSREQNFVVDFFHASSLESIDFIDCVQAAPPSGRHGTNLLARKPVDPDRELAGIVTDSMLKVFDFFLPELKAMQDWAIAEDPIQGVGILASLNRHTYYLQDSSQDYLLQLLNNLTESLKTRFVKFVDEQIRAIEDTKVKIKKRKGVIAFMKIFPHFSAAVENVFSAVAGNDYDGPSACVMEVRKLVDGAYERINRTMFDSLKVIAKESPGAGAPVGKQGLHAGTDDQDKEMLNYHILLIENMNHYVEEVDDGNRDGVLAEWKGRAMMEKAEALEAYVLRVIRRPLGKLMDFLESAESILTSNPTNPVSALSSRPSYSRKAIRTLLSQHDSKEVRRGIDTLRKRIEKHFGEADEEQLSRGLVSLVCKECERSYENVLSRTETLVKEVYSPSEGEKDVVIEFSRADIQAGFRR